MNKIIIINDPYGIGKTTIANKLSELFGDDVVCIDPDLYYNELVQKNFNLFLCGWPVQNNSLFLKYFRGIVEENLKIKNVVIPMAITFELCKNELLNYICAKTNVIHIVLDSDKQSLIQRINNDTKRNKDFSLEHMEESINYINENFSDVIHIDTTNKSIMEIACIIADCYLNVSFE